MASVGVVGFGILEQCLPNLDSEILDYIHGVLECPEDFASSEEVFDAVGGVLLEAAEGSSEEGIQELCDQLYAAMKGGSGDNGGESEARKLLEAPVHLGQRLRNTDADVAALSSIWMVQNDSKSAVDKRRLEKADAKLKQKQEKRAAQKELVSASESKGLSLGGPTTNQAISRHTGRSEATGGLLYDIKIDNFDIAYGDLTLLSNALLSLVYGRRYGLVGRNGIGKTTLMRAIAARELQLPAHLTILHVEQEVEGDETIALQSVLQSDTERERLLRRERELLTAGDRSPGPESPGPGKSELAEVYERLQEIDADQAPARAAGILAGLGFSPEMQTRQTREFSGGWRMRLALAKALFSKPDLLLLDEPTNMLDIRAILWLEDYLQSWSSTILVVSHARTFLTAVCTDIIHMHSQRLDAYRGNYETFVRTKTEKLKNQQREYEAQMQYRQHLQDFVDRWRYNAKRAPQAQSRLKILEKLPELQPVVVEPEVILRFPETEKLSPPILQLTDVTFSYTPGDLVFKKMNISADMDSRIALVGENGSGKSTLVKLLTGELSPQDGYRQAHRNLKIAYFTQHHVDQLVMELTPLQLIQSRFPGKREEEYRHQLGSFGVTGELALRPIVSLSGGQKSRLAFALMAMTRPNYLIFDEPTNHLDVETVEALGKALTKFKGGVILVSHDEHLIEMLCNEVWLCTDQTVLRLEGGLQQYRAALEAEVLGSKQS